MTEDRVESAIPRTLGAPEIDTVYVHPTDRYIVSLIVGYEDDPQLDRDFDRGDRMLSAAAAALDLTRDPGRDGTRWHIYDRLTGEARTVEQEEFDRDRLPWPLDQEDDND